MKKLFGILGLLLVVASPGAAGASGASAPSFALARSYATGRTPFSVAMGDLNGDGKPDLATANYLADTVSVLVNRGDGSFQARHDYATGEGPQSVLPVQASGSEA